MSDWVEWEVELAFERERHPPGTLKLFPIRLDDAAMQTNTAGAGDIRRIRCIGDFHKWQDETAYQRALQRLLCDMQYEGGNNMAKKQHLDLLKQGIVAWNTWRTNHQNIQPNLSGADLSEANLSEADLGGADLSEANLSGTDLRNANLTLANLTGATFRGVTSIETNKTGSFYRKTYGSRITASKFSRRWSPSSDSRHVTYASANLSGASLGGANLSGANLSGADLSGAYLHITDLTEAILKEADLSEADLTEANLSRADLSDADLSGADLSKAVVSATIFAGVDLLTTKGLVEIEHRGPSHVTLHTVQLPQDGSALHFLRGAGVPDEWIDFYRANMMHPIHYHSVFISYSSKDDMLAHRLRADLQERGVRCWFAPEDMKIGDKIRARIDEAIHRQDKLLLLLSGHALASPWVEDEVEAALEKEQGQQRDVLFPVRLDESVMQTSQAWAAKLRRTRHIGDFTNWTDPQAYRHAFEQLLRDLKAEIAYGKKGTP